MDPQQGDNSLELTPSGYVAPDDDESSNASDIRVETVTSSVLMNVRMRIPCKEAVCPISLDLVNDSHVDRFEGFLVDPSYPLHTEIILPCDHSFSASFLMVSWLTSPMRCPMCREGLDQHLGVKNFPLAWRALADAHIERIQDEDRAEQVASDASMAMQLNFISTSSVQLFMVVYFVCADGSASSTVVSFTMGDHEISQDPSQEMPLRVTRAHNRVMATEINRTGCTKLNLVVFARCVRTDISLVEIANSGIITIPVAEDFPGPDNRVHGCESRDVWVVQRSTGSGLNDGPSHAIFSMSWTHNRHRSMDTLTGCTFYIPFGDLAYILSSMYG